MASLVACVHIRNTPKTKKTYYQGKGAPPVSVTTSSCVWYCPSLNQQVEKMKWEYSQPQLGFCWLVNFTVKVASAVGQYFEGDNISPALPFSCGTHYQKMTLNPCGPENHWKAAVFPQTGETLCSWCGRHVSETTWSVHKASGKLGKERSFLTVQQGGYLVIMYCGISLTAASRCGILGSITDHMRY